MSQSLHDGPHKPVRNMTCACCGARTTGRQWHNRDTGYGLCTACIDYCASRITPAAEFRRCYGDRGIHFDIKEENTTSMSAADDDREYDHEDDYDRGDAGDGTRFADPGGRSALRAAGRHNPRNLPCPNCKAPNRLTPADRARGYQCNACADALERGGY